MLQTAASIKVILTKRMERIENHMRAVMKDSMFKGGAEKDFRRAEYWLVFF